MKSEVELVAQIAAVVRELESLDLTKAARDRRLTLNGELEAMRIELVAAQRQRELEAGLAQLETELAALGQTPGDKLKRRELAKDRSRLERELAELRAPSSV